MIRRHLLDSEIMMLLMKTASRELWSYAIGHFRECVACTERKSALASEITEQKAKSDVTVFRVVRQEIAQENSDYSKLGRPDAHE